MLEYPYNDIIKKTVQILRTEVIFCKVVRKDEEIIFRLSCRSILRHKLFKLRVNA